jgi:hypothetical protein
VRDKSDAELQWPQRSSASDVTGHLVTNLVLYFEVGR